MATRLNNMDKDITLQLARDSQYQKELSIPYFNGLNNAVQLIVASTTKTMSLDKKLEMIRTIRDMFIEEYKQYRVNARESVPKSLVEPNLTEGLEKARKLYANTTGSTAGNGGVAQ